MFRLPAPSSFPLFPASLSFIHTVFIPLSSPLLSFDSFIAIHLIIIFHCFILYSCLLCRIVPIPLAFILLSIIPFIPLTSLTPLSFTLYPCRHYPSHLHTSIHYSFFLRPPFLNLSSFFTLVHIPLSFR